MAAPAQLYHKRDVDRHPWRLLQWRPMGQLRVVVTLPPRAEGEARETPYQVGPRGPVRGRGGCRARAGVQPHARFAVSDRANKRMQRTRLRRAAGMQRSASERGSLSLVAVRGPSVIARVPSSW